MLRRRRADRPGHRGHVGARGGEGGGPAAAAAARRLRIAKRKTRRATTAASSATSATSATAGEATTAPPASATAATATPGNRSVGQLLTHVAPPADVVHEDGEPVAGWFVLLVAVPLGGVPVVPVAPREREKVGGEAAHRGLGGAQLPGAGRGTLAGFHKARRQVTKIEVEMNFC